MMKVGKLMLSFLCILTIYSCQKENYPELLNQEYGINSNITKNVFEVKEGNVLIGMEQPYDLIYIDSAKLIFTENEELSSLQVGDNLVHIGTDRESDITILSKIEHIEKNGTQVILETSPLSLSEAFERYLYDSRVEEFVIVRENYRWEFKSKLAKTNITGALQATINPDLEISPTYDMNNSHFRSGAFSAENIVPWFDIFVKEFSINLSGRFTLEGQISTGYVKENFLPEPFQFPFPPLGIAVYLNPKFEALIKLKGKVTSPTYTETYGPVDIIFKYDPNGENPIPVDARMVPTFTPNSNVLQNDWDINASGSFNIKTGANMYISQIGPKATHIAKAGAFSYVYITTNLIQDGNFTNKTPSIRIQNELGIGTKYFATLGGVVPEFFPNFIQGTIKLESAEDNQKWGELNTIISKPICQTFDVAEVDVRPNEIDLEIDCTNCPSNHYYVYLNDSILNKNNPFPFGEITTFPIPFELDIINSIQVSDTSQQYCSLYDDFLDPAYAPNCEPDLNQVPPDFCDVTIGSQIWMPRNLVTAGSTSGPVGVWYNNDPAVENAVFGKLYTWDEVMLGDPGKNEGDSRNIRGICPSGYHIPSKEEYEELINFYGGYNLAGKKIKYPNSYIWPNANLPSENTFGAMPSGEYYKWLYDGRDPIFTNGEDNQYFGKQKEIAFLWTSTVRTNEQGGIEPLFLKINTIDNIAKVGINGNDYFGKSIKEIGYACRCLKN